MSEELFKVVTTNGTTVTTGPNGGGLGEEKAGQEVERRNHAALALDIKVRYEVAPLGDAA